jgi:2-oxoglutarate dehydrogenase E1 component
LETRAEGARKMMQQYRANSYLFGGNAPYVEELYEAYLDNPGSVPDNWRAYFDRLQNVAAVDGSEARDVAHAPVVESFAQRAKANSFALKVTDGPSSTRSSGPKGPRFPSSSRRSTT